MSREGYKSTLAPLIIPSREEFNATQQQPSGPGSGPGSGLSSPSFVVKNTFIDLVDSNSDKDKSPAPRVNSAPSSPQRVRDPWADLEQEVLERRGSDPFANLVPGQAIAGPDDAVQPVDRKARKRKEAAEARPRAEGKQDSKECLANFVRRASRDHDPGQLGEPAFLQPVPPPASFFCTDSSAGGHQSASRGHQYELNIKEQLDAGKSQSAPPPPDWTPKNFGELAPPPPDWTAIVQPGNLGEGLFKLDHLLGSGYQQNWVPGQLGGMPLGQTEAPGQSHPYWEQEQPSRSQGWAPGYNIMQEQGASGKPQKKKGGQSNKGSASGGQSAGHHGGSQPWMAGGPHAQSPPLSAGPGWFPSPQYITPTSPPGLPAGMPVHQSVPDFLSGEQRGVPVYPAVSEFQKGTPSHFNRGGKGKDRQQFAPNGGGYRANNAMDSQPHVGSGGGRGAPGQVRVNSKESTGKKGGRGGQRNQASTQPSLPTQVGTPSLPSSGTTRKGPGVQAGGDMYKRGVFVLPGAGLQQAEIANAQEGGDAANASSSTGKTENQNRHLGGGGPKRTDYNKKYGAATLAAESEDAPVAITTMMLRNIPCRKSAEDVMSHINQNGFETLYDFFYLPQDIQYRANLGYAFINFLRPEDAEMFKEKMNGYRFGCSGSAKACQVVPAHIQGLMNNLAAFKRTEVMRSNRKPFFSGVITI